jgi:hypothetical protein
MQNLMQDLFLTTPETLPLCKEMVSFYQVSDKWYKAEGNQGTKRVKAIVSYLQQVALGENPSPIDPSLWVSTDKSGCPIWISQACTTLRKGQNYGTIRRILSAYQPHIQFNGVLTDKDILNSVTTIVSKGKKVDDVTMSSFEDFLKLFFKTYASDPGMKSLFQGPKNLIDSTFKSTGPLTLLKKGANGIYITNVHKDIVALQESGLESYISDLAHSISETTQGIKSVKWSTKYRDQVIALYEGNSSDSEFDGCRTGKITVIPEKAGKLRIIAQGTYPHQRVLQPIHDSLCLALGSFVTDCTYNQELGVDKMKEWSVRTNPYMASFDHSACTDLFPVTVQEQVLKYYYRNAGIAHNWRSLMESTEFSLTLPSGKGRKIKYGRGQPMGLFSSWPAMALTHHFLVHFAVYQKMHGKLPGKPFKDYCILGDDIVIANSSVAKFYLDTVQKLGMKVNLSKSHLPDSLHGPSRSVGEFAKRFVIDGQDVSPVPAKLILASLSKNGHKLVPLLWRKLAKASLFPSLKRTDWLLKRYWPKASKRYLNLLLMVNSSLGGFGYRTDVPKNRYVIHNGANVVSLELCIMANRFLSMKRRKVAKLPNVVTEDHNIDPKWALMSNSPLREVLASYSGPSVPDRIPSLSEFFNEILLEGFNLDPPGLVGEFKRTIGTRYDEVFLPPLSLRPFDDEVDHQRLDCSAVERWVKFV